jgi:hypothetical protein
MYSTSMSISNSDNAVKHQEFFTLLSVLSLSVLMNAFLCACLEHYSLWEDVRPSGVTIKIVYTLEIQLTKAAVKMKL